MDQPAVETLLALLCLTPGLLPQELLWERVGVERALHYESGLASLGDVNGDGWSDILVRGQTLEAIGAGVKRESVLFLLSGRDGSTLRLCLPPAPDRVYSVPIAAGDWNLDGTPDYAITVAHAFDWRIPNALEVRSGGDDTVLWRIQELATGIALLLDLDGDGRKDLILRTTGSWHGYTRDGQRLYSLSSTAAYLLHQTPPARIGDLDGDGGDDFAVPAFFLPFPYVATGALLVSGRTGTVLREVRESRFPFDYFQYVAGPGDLDGDGVPDLAMSSGGTFGGQHIVAAYSGATGQPLWWTRTAAANSYLGFNGLYPADLDGDGVQDLLAGALNEGSPGPYRVGALYGLSGRDGAVLFRVGNEELASTGLGTFLDVVAPAPGEPFPMFVSNEFQYGRYTWQQGSWEKGRVRLYRGVPRDVRAIGGACTGGLGRSPTIGLRDLARSGAGDRVRVHLAGAAPGVSTCFVLGASRTSWNGVPLPYDLTFLGLSGCALYTSVDAFAARTTGTSGIDAGYAFVDVPLPLAPPDVIGTPVYAQWLLFGPGNTWPGGLTQALTWPR